MQAPKDTSKGRRCLVSRSLMGLSSDSPLASSFSCISWYTGESDTRVRM